MEVFDAKLVWTILHLIGVSIGLGGALFGDSLFFLATRNGILSLHELRLLRRSGSFVTLGLLILIFSGVGLFFQDPARYMESSKFLSKMVVVAVIAFNGAVLHSVHFETLRRLVGMKLRESRLFRRRSFGLFISGAVSVSSWLFALVLGSLRSIPYSMLEVLYVYLVVVCVAIGASLFARGAFLRR